MFLYFFFNFKDYPSISPPSFAMVFSFYYHIELFLEFFLFLLIILDLQRSICYDFLIRIWKGTEFNEKRVFYAPVNPAELFKSNQK